MPSSAKLSGPKIALVGNSNAGKSTLFNALTSSRQKTVNAPGTTVSIETGMWEDKELIDLPGLVSLYHISPDEEVAANALWTSGGRHCPDLIIFVADIPHLSRALYLLAQIKHSNISIVLALTMADLLKKKGVELDVELVGNLTGVEEVVLLDTRRKVGLDELTDKVNRVLKVAPKNTPETALDKNAHDDVRAWAKKHADEHFKWASDVQKTVGLNKLDDKLSTYWLDKILLNRFFSVIAFLLIMLLVFSVTTIFSSPFVELIDVNLRDALTSGLGFFLQDGPAVLNSFVLNVLLESAVAISQLLPPLFFIFILLAVLEESGCLTRFAIVADRVMRFAGLDGRALLPLVLGFGCNLPAISATKALQDSRSRTICGYLIPFTLCNARLAVFVIIANALFPDCAGLVVFLLYITSILLVILVGMFLNLFCILKNREQQEKMPFIIPLGTYQRPLLKSTLHLCMVKMQQFILNAGKIITVVIAIMWILQNAPIPGSGKSFGEVDNVEDSVYGVVAESICPVLKPAGFGSWHISSAVITGFLAKETVLASLANSYAVDNADEDDASTQNSGLAENLRQTFAESSSGQLKLAGAVFLFFMLTYTPCLATVSGIKREFGGRFALKSVALSLSVAYVVSVLIFQVGALFT
ncbi:MAG: ferrous iron transporter B [Candidatus Ancillula trichonymphae]|jgi:ferrous iron transport protein B|nr:ferrous iron transporter B [Candidatus Ancillula trichonymphae]